jgi:hypothetical protein
MIEEKKTPKWIAKALYVSMGIAAVALGVFYYWALTPMDIIQIKNSPVEIRPPQNTVGNAEILTHNFCKLTDDHGTLRISFVGVATENFLPISQENSPKQCNDKLEFPILIPQTLAPGKYHVHFKATYKPNPIRTVIEEWDSQSFEVVQ